MPYRVGDPVVMRFPGGTSTPPCDAYGRVCGFSGDSFRGEYPVVHVLTPAGSELFAGRAYVRPVETDEDREKLAAFDVLARRGLGDVVLEHDVEGAPLWTGGSHG